MELDQAFRYLGNFGRYQTLTYCLLSIVAFFLTSIQVMGIVIVSYTPKPYHCTPPKGFYINETVPVFLDEGIDTYDSCHMYVVHNGEVTENVTGCQFGWDFETFHGEQSVVTDFDLVCDDAILAKLSVSVFMAGILFGSVTSGQLADIYGRKPVLFIALVCEALSGVGMALAYNYYAVVFFWFLLGFFEQGLRNCAFVMIMEMFAPEKRTFAGAISGVIRGVGDMVVSPIAYGLPNWRHYELLVSLIGLLVLPAWWFIPESARWLVSRGRVEEAEKVLTRIADFNNIPVPPTSFLSSSPQKLREEDVPLRTPQEEVEQNDKQDVNYKQLSAPQCDLRGKGHRTHSYSGGKSSPTIAQHNCISTEPPATQQVAQKHTLFDIFKSRMLLENFLIIAYAWFVVGFGFYGLSLYSAELAGNVYFNLFLLCLVEIPAFIVAYIMLNWIGRRISLSISFFITGVFCVLIACVPDETRDGKDISSLIVALATGGKFTITVAVAATNVFTPELFPTYIRNVGFGACSFFARLGGIVAPFVLYLNQFSEFIPLNIFGISALIAGMLSLFLPETNQKPLPETVQDCERQGHSSLCFFKRDRLESFDRQSIDNSDPTDV